MAKFFMVMGDGSFAFLDSAVHEIPPSAKPVSSALFKQTVSDRPSNKVLSVDSEGMPCLIDPAVPSFADIQAGALKGIDADVDAIYSALIGNRQAEYDTAEREAQAYKDAGYSGTVPASVQAWETAKKWTAKQAADDILAASAAWRAAQADIRANRLARKEDVRNAKDPAAVEAVMTTWAAYVEKTRTALGA